MNGAQSLVETLVTSGVTTCFSNPGTSEMHFVAATDTVAEMRAVLCLFEGVATGAADGYGRMMGSPAATLLHLGPGLANGLANLHNARRAATPIVNIVGDHATGHLQYDSPLTSDIEAIASTMSGWVHTSASAKTVAYDAALAVAKSMEGQGQIATLILPANTAWDAAEGAAPALPRAALAGPDTGAIDRAAKALSNGQSTVLLIGGDALSERGTTAAGRISAATGARLMCSRFARRRARGAGRVIIEPLQYFPGKIIEQLQGTRQMVLAGCEPPVSFFAYPGQPSWMAPDDCKIVYAAQSHDNITLALEALADALDAPAAPIGIASHQTALPSFGDALDQFSIGAIVAHLMPEHAIISDEALTCATGPATATVSSVTHDWLSISGGSIGQGLPVATGAAVACPHRKTICLHGDGGAMYTVQSLWTQARENLDVTTVIFNNRSYAILNLELGNVGVGRPGPKALSQLDLGNPALDWVKISEGMGVSASRATTVREFHDQFLSAMKQRGPQLIEAVI